MHSVFLDLRTLSIVLMLVTAFLCALMIYIWRVHKTYDGFGLWAMSNVLAAIAFLLLGLRDIVPDFFSIITGNTLALCGAVLTLEGNRRFLGMKADTIFNVSLLALHTVIMVYFTYIDYSVINRIIFSSVFAAIITERIFSMFNRKCAAETNLTYKFTSATNLAFSVLMILRAICTYLFSNINQLYTPDWIQALTFMMFLIFSIIWTFNYMILNNQRMQNELLSAQTELEKLAATDFLTGINNSRRFFEISETEVARARRFHHSLSVIMFDLDYFKNVNDSHGHAGGDAVLVKVAEICKITLRNVDVAGRLGGEEFAFLLPHTTIGGAATVAQFLRSAIEDAEIEFSGEKIKITASFGIAELHDSDSEIKEVLDRADTALYEAKRKGRNQIVVKQHPENQKIRAAA
jgi:diguanylate cyclase (GGDEF)-like protein